MEKETDESASSFNEGAHTSGSVRVPTTGVRDASLKSVTKTWRSLGIENSLFSLGFPVDALSPVLSTTAKRAREHPSWTSPKLLCRPVRSQKSSIHTTTAEASSLMHPNMRTAVSKSWPATRNRLVSTLVTARRPLSIAVWAKAQRCYQLYIQSLYLPVHSFYLTWELTISRYAPSNLDPEARPGFSDIVDKLAKDNKARKDFLRACLTKLGLQADQESEIVPSLSSIHVSAKEPDDASTLFSSFQDIITAEDGEEYLVDDNDKFRIKNRSALGMGSLATAIPGSSHGETDKDSRAEDRIPDYGNEVKHLVLQENIPGSKETPYFNHDHYYANLKEYQSQSKEPLQNFGSPLMYGEVVTSTNTLLEK